LFRDETTPTNISLLVQSRQGYATLRRDKRCVSSGFFRHNSNTTVPIAKAERAVSPSLSCLASAQGYLLIPLPVLKLDYRNFLTVDYLRFLHTGHVCPK